MPKDYCLLNSGLGRPGAIYPEQNSMYGVPKFSVSRKDAVHKLFALVFTSGAAGLVGFGAFAIGSAFGASAAVGIAFASLASLSLFWPLLSMLSTPPEEIRVMSETAPPLRKVFSGLF